MKFIGYFLLLTAVSAISTSKLIGEDQSNELCKTILSITQQRAQDYIDQQSVDDLAAIRCGTSPGLSLINWLSFWTDRDRNCDQIYPIAKALIKKGVIPTDDDQKYIDLYKPCQKITDCLLNKNCPQYQDQNK